MVENYRKEYHQHQVKTGKWYQVFLKHPLGMHKTKNQANVQGKKSLKK